MARPLLSRLTLAAALCAMTATPALAGKKKGKGKKRKQATVQQEADANAAPGSRAAAGPRKGPHAGARPGPKAGPKKGPQAARPGAQAGPRKGPKAGPGPRVQGAKPRQGQGPRAQGAKPRQVQGPKVGPRQGPRAGQGPRAQGAKPRQGQGPRAQGAKPRQGQGQGPMVGPRQGPRTGQGPRAGQGPRVGQGPRAQGDKPRQGQGPKVGPRQGPRAGQGARPGGGPLTHPGETRGPRTHPGSGVTTDASVGQMVQAGEGRRPGRKVRVEQPSFLPEGWAPKAHRYHLKNVPRYSPAYWGSGVFFYNPPPSRHEVVYVEKNVVTGSSSRVEAPRRAVDRGGSLAVGIKGGALVERQTLVDASERVGQVTGDTGYGIAARYRPIESLGIEASWMRHEDLDGALVRDPVSLSGQLFAFPWTRMSPHVSAGVSFDGPGSQAHSPDGGRRFTPHAGLGLELALGRSVAFDIEARYLSEMQALSDDPLSDGAVQATAGLMVHF